MTKELTGYKLTGDAHMDCLIKRMVPLYGDDKPAYAMVRKWEDVFTSFTECRGGTETNPPGIDNGISIDANNVNGPYRYGTVAIAPDYVSPILGHMLPRHGISFHVVIHDDGTALVMARYSSILGSMYLAVIDASTIPAYREVAYGFPGCGT